MKTQIVWRLIQLTAVVSCLERIKGQCGEYLYLQRREYREAGESFVIRILMMDDQIKEDDILRTCHMDWLYYNG